MNKEIKQFPCPHCEQLININDIVDHQLHEEMDKKIEETLILEKKRIEKELEQKREKLEKKYELEQELQKQKQQEKEDMIQRLHKELGEKSEQVKELNNSKIEIEKLQREKEEIKAKTQLEYEKEVSELTKKIRNEEKNHAQLELYEKEQIIKNLGEELKKTQRKAEQGSIQLQGEVQELAIEKFLSDTFPLDKIEEIKKGQQGADCLQIVYNNSQQNCGSIYYESKRTKSFQESWIEKFKLDIQEKNSSIAVLVTETMPRDMKRVGKYRGIWVCSYEEFKGLSVVLRDSLIQIYNMFNIQTNKGDKMSSLYNFLTSDEFRLQVETILDGFIQLKSELESEKRSMQSIWKRREKQIERVLLNTNNMYSSIKGIAGNAVQNIPLLELK